jgi:L-ascorbate metabolism protein UlaG (beta-lactamase superfamily)
MHYAHMDIPEVLRAFEDLGADSMIPTQWGVLKLGDEPAAWPMKVLQQALATTHQDLADRVKILPIGGRLTLE